ncbi:hypothetical protein [Nonomuraea diastatica]|uniref:Uncharacterized protein n=1 Tax=Nonomuraea diastatica TaxID=1848329 RepID=A0A4R4W4R0_9ACTN|nr:hypothetical protein [Nonomuraea diastatica]TDD12911.1 hypothetical protein E1294_43040 [Nonomuraea diastatica]
MAARAHVAREYNLEGEMIGAHIAMIGHPLDHPRVDQMGAPPFLRSSSAKPSRGGLFLVVGQPKADGRVTTGRYARPLGDPDHVIAS